MCLWYSDLLGKNWLGVISRDDSNIMESTVTDALTRRNDVAKETRRRKANVVTEINFAMTIFLTLFTIMLSRWPGCNERTLAHHCIILFSR
jgi:hypothetical protein